MPAVFSSRLWQAVAASKILDDKYVTTGWGYYMRVRYARVLGKAAA
jgi:hypothetical protein